MTRDHPPSNSSPQPWRTSTPTKRDEIFTSSPRNPSPLARSVFRSPYTPSLTLELNNGRSPSLDQLTWLAVSSSPPRQPDRTPRSRSAPNSVVRSTSAARSVTGTPSGPRSRALHKAGRPALGEGDVDHPMPALPVILRSSEGDEVYMTAELFHEVSWYYTALGPSAQLEIRLNHPTTTLHLFVSLAHTPRTRWPALLAITPLSELFTLYGLLRDLDADPLLRATRQAIEDYAAEWPWEVLQFASGLGDVQMGRWAIRGLAGREGDRLIRGDWDSEDTQWMLELLRLKDKHTSLPLTSVHRMTPTTPIRTPLSPSRSVLSPSRNYTSSPLRFSSGPWRPSQGHHSSTGTTTPTKSSRMGTVTPPRSARRRVVVDWEAVAREFDPPVEAA